MHALCFVFVYIGYVSFIVLTLLLPTEYPASMYIKLDSNPEEASRSAGENLTRIYFCLC